MAFIEGLHGTIAVIALCGLLFIDEAGMPIPVAPNEVLLLVAGLLIASGGISPWVFLPAAGIAMGAGMIAGYAWARAVGQTGLCALVDRLGATKHYNRTRDRLVSAGPVAIGVARMLPGVRPYVTLISGAAQIKLRTFLLGAIPALIAWEIILIGLGMVVGLPAEHYLGRFQRLALRGLLMAGIGIAAYFGLRRLAVTESVPTRWLPERGSSLLAAIVGGCIVASVATGLLAVGRRIAGVQAYGWIDLTIIAVLVAAFLVYSRGRDRLGLLGSHS
jgi:membrane protein DedA with SNARE-associated domain